MTPTRRAPASTPIRSITHAKGEDGAAKGFVVHRLVQDFARRAMTRGAPGRGAAGGAGLGQRGVRRRSATTCEAGRSSTRSRRTRSRSRGARTRRGSPSRPARLFNELGTAVQGEGALRRGRAALSPRAGDRRGELRAGPSRRGDRPQQSREPAPGHEPPRRGRAALSPRARDRRDELRAGSSRSGDRPQQSRAAAPRHEPPRRGRAALSPRARDRRGELRAGSSRCGDGPQQSRGAAPRHEPPRRGRAALFAARWRSTRRATGRIIPNVAIGLNNLAGLLQATNRLAEAEPLYRRALAIDETSYGPDHPNVATASTISRRCFKPRTASPRPSRSIAARWRSSKRASDRTIRTRSTVRENLAALEAALGKGT